MWYVSVALAAPPTSAPAVARDVDGTMWAVGNSGEGEVLAPFSAYWDGSAWTGIAVPAGRYGHDRLTDVAVVAPGVIWAVGYTTDQSRSLPVALRWNGSAWDEVRMPQAGRVYAIDGTGPDDLWAVGESGGEALVLHWDGTSWKRKSVAHAGPLTAVHVHGSTDVWAAGGGFAIHWNGKAWSEARLFAETRSGW
jgi:hypothetical protein